MPIETVTYMVQCDWCRLRAGVSSSSIGVLPEDLIAKQGWYIVSSRYFCTSNCYSSYMSSVSDASGRCIHCGRHG